MTARPAAHTRKRPRAIAPRSLRRRGLGLLVCVLALLITVVAGLAVGARSIPPGEVVAALVGGPRTEGVSHDTLVVLDLRLPRTVIGLVAGACLGVAGALVQAVTRNPLADPGILGTTSGAAFALAIAAGFAGLATPVPQLLVAFVGALVATVAVYAIGSLGHGGGSPVRLVLAGTALGAVLVGITNAIVLSDPARFSAMQAWRAGSLVDRGWTMLGPALPFIAVGLVLAGAIAGSLNAVALGDDLAAALGANVVLVRAVAIAAVTLLAGAATALAGPIAFVGLMVPHIARWIVGPDQRWIVAYALLLGATLLVVSDVVGRVVIPPAEVPAGIVTALIGGPVLIALVRLRTASEL